MLVEIWKILFLSIFPLLCWPFIYRHSKKKAWTAINFEKKPIPYTLGAGLLLYVLVAASYFDYNVAFLAYVGMIWLAGWIDDRNGDAYPKGIKGHLQYFVKRKQWTTGLTKIIFIISAAGAGVYMLYEKLDAGMFLACLLLILSPHVCNALDTRPLRVWKWFVAHVTFICIVFSLTPSWSFIIYVSAAAAFWWFLEAKQKAMLGDNGATVIGGCIGWLAIQHTPFVFQIILVVVYLSLTLIAERLSIHSIIKKVEVLSQLDQWGRKEG